ncbi:MAG: Ig-like domain-containing protein [Novosphingobium sp.]
MIDPLPASSAASIDNSASQDGTGGVHSVTVTADDGNGGSVDQTFTWTVTNPGPTANDDTATTDEDTPVSGNVITASGPGDVADSDPDADTLIITTFTVDGDATTYNAGETATISGIGTIMLAEDGDYTFTPDANWNGTVPTVTYTVSDSEGGTDTANLDITVNPINDAPEAAGTIADQSNLDAEGITDLDASSFFSDVDGDTLGFSAVGLPNGLMIDPVTGIISGTIDNSASQDGTGGVHSVTVTADDGNGGSVDQTFTWTVTNPGPTANDDTATTDEDTPVSGNVITASGPGDVADSDPDADTLIITTFTVDGDATTYNAGETATISGIGTIMLAEDGDYTFTPDANWNGTVPTVTYTVSDSEGGTDTANLDITVNPVVDLTAADDSNTTDEDTPVSGSVAGNDNTTSGGTLTFAKHSDPANGTVVVNPDGTYTYTPNADFNGEDSFTYTVTDADSGESLTQTVTITVNPINDAPEAAGTIADQSNLDAEGITDLDASSFFSDVDGDTLGFSAVGLPNGLMIDPVTGIISGTIDNSASQDGTGGVHSVTVTADDGNGGSVDQTFTWTVTNPGPTANDDTATTDEDRPVSGNVITASGPGDVADSDPDADTLIITTFTVDGDATTYNAGETATISGIGTITLAEDGDYTFTPDAN